MLYILDIKYLTCNNYEEFSLFHSVKTEGPWSKKISLVNVPYWKAEVYEEKRFYHETNRKNDAQCSDTGFCRVLLS